MNPERNTLETTFFKLIMNFYSLKSIIESSLLKLGFVHLMKLLWSVAAWLLLGVGFSIFYYRAYIHVQQFSGECQSLIDEAFSGGHLGKNLVFFNESFNRNLFARKCME